MPSIPRWDDGRGVRPRRDGPALRSARPRPRLPGHGPCETLPSLRTLFPRASIVVVSMVDDDLTIRQVMAFGVDGFICKVIASDRNKAALAEVRAGGRSRPVAQPGRVGVHQAQEGGGRAPRAWQVQQERAGDFGIRMDIERMMTCIFRITRVQGYTDYPSAAMTDLVNGTGNRRRVFFEQSSEGRHLRAQRESEIELALFHRCQG